MEPLKPFDSLQVIQDGARSAAHNMARDEALLRNATQPVLRAYSWIEPSVSIGCFHPYASAQLRSGARPIVRRWTGGGLVEHSGGQDGFTYSIVVPQAILSSRTWKVRDSYRLFHSALVRALEVQGFQAALAMDGKSVAGSACFEAPVDGDVMLGQRKIAGAAQRRSAEGLLQQGSVQGVSLPHRFLLDFAEELSLRVEMREFNRDEENIAAKSISARYGTAAWLQRR